MLNNILLIFTVLVLFTAILGIVYANGLHPNNKKVEKIIQKFSSNNYSITYYIAERYLTWLHMRTFFITLNYLLTLVGIIANLLTIFYASIADKNTNEVIIFFSLLSTYFTIGNIFINPCSLSNMAQHAWRELDTCIAKTLYMNELSTNDKNMIINNKINELEKYIETFEH